MKNRISLMIASAFHIGFIRGAPGTYASVATSVAFFLVFLYSHRILPGLHLSIIGFITVIGVLTSHDVSRKTGVEDPSFVVIDEVAGQLLTFFYLPVSAFNLILGTIAFRVFDIWKPFPVRKLETLGNGAGIMADDLMAGVYANLVLQLLELSF